MRELALSYGVIPTYMEKRESVDEFIHVSLIDLLKNHDISSQDIVVVLAGNFSRGTGFSFIEVGTVDYLKARVRISEKDLLA